MKKLLAGLVAVAALSSTAAMAETPAQRELNDFSHILSVTNKNREASAKPSEFVIYHQDSHRPCPPEHEHAQHGKMMHHHHAKPEHKAEHKHEHKRDEHKHHHHHDMKKDKSAKTDKKPAVSEQNQSPAGDDATKQ